MLAIQPVDLSLLEQMKEALSASAGYAVSMEAETRYFQETRPRSWFAAISEGRIVGFIRPFSQGEDWTNIEFFVSPECGGRAATGSALLRAFQREASYKPGHRVRIDLLGRDRELNLLVREAGLSQQRQVFHHFGIRIRQAQGEPLSAPLIIEPPERLAAVLCGLHPVSPEEAGRWLAEGTLRTLSEGGQAVCVAQIYVHEGSAEINRLATIPGALRNGHARKLLHQLFEEFSRTGVRECFLKVEDSRAPAIALYRSVGFTEVEDKAEIWHSRWY